MLPMFSFYIYKVDKKIFKNTRGKSGKFTFIWKYITVVNSSDNGKYLISEQGYAGFEIFLEIYFKGLPANDPVRKVRIDNYLFDCQIGVFI